MIILTQPLEYMQYQVDLYLQKDHAAQMLQNLLPLVSNLVFVANLYPTEPVIRALEKIIPTCAYLHKHISKAKPKTRVEQRPIYNYPILRPLYQNTIHLLNHLLFDLASAVSKESTEKEKRSIPFLPTLAKQEQGSNRPITAAEFFSMLKTEKAHKFA